MAYELEAVIGAESTIDAAIEALDEARCVPLAQGVAMIPLTEGLLKEMEKAYGAEEEPSERRDDDFSAAVAGWARSASRHGLLAWCWAAYAGIGGTQGAVIWRDGAKLEESDSVNRALHLLGVTCEEGEDEWDTVGLGRCRLTERWLELAKS